MSDKLPLGRNWSWDLRAKGRSYPAGWNDNVFVYVFTPGYFDAMDIRLRQGRDLNWHDTPTSKPAIIINEATARRDWPGQNPIGQVARGIGDSDTTVIGVIPNVRDSSVEEASNRKCTCPLPRQGRMARIWSYAANLRHRCLLRACCGRCAS